MSEKEIREVVDNSLMQEKYSFIYEEVAKEGGLYKAFNLIGYIPTEEAIIADIDLQFFDDKLYSIDAKTNNPYIEDLLSKKYGKPKKKTEVDYENIAEGRHGGRDRSPRVISETIIQQWKTNDKDISCRSKYKSNTQVQFDKTGEWNASYSLLIKNKAEEKKLDSIKKQLDQQAREKNEREFNRIIDEI